MKYHMVACFSVIRYRGSISFMNLSLPAAQGETSVVRAWHLRSSLLWENGEWIEWSGSKVGSHSTKVHSFDISLGIDLKLSCLH